MYVGADTQDFVSVIDPGLPALDAGAVLRLLSNATAVLGDDAEAALECIKRAAAILQTTSRAMEGRQSGLVVWQTERVKRHVKNNIHRKIPIAELANLAKLSCGHFTHTFKVSIGTSPSAYIASCRVSRAMQLLKCTSMSLSEIALDCGFCDQAHMSRRFSRAVGVSPNLWRKSCASNDFVPTF